MSEQKKNKVGRPPLCPRSATTNDGFTTTEADVEQLELFIIELNRKGYNTNKSEFIRLAIRAGMKAPTKLFKGKKRKAS